jgi:hypothetical protein
MMAELGGVPSTASDSQASMMGQLVSLPCHLLDLVASWRSFSSGVMKPAI